MRIWRHRGTSPRLTAGYEAFLAGLYLEYLEDLGWPPPPWAWTNRLAHATEQELVETVGAPVRRSEKRRSRWEQARRYLAGEVLDAATSEGSLLRLQAEILVPLEFELMGQAGQDLTPSTWASLVLSALHNQHRTAPHRH